jgi:hypothetical protein
LLLSSEKRLEKKSEATMYVSVLVRKLKPGKTVDDFVRAWYPEQGFGIGGRGPILARNVADERELIAVALMDLDTGETLEQVMTRIAGQESARHNRIDDVIESTTLRGIYEVVHEFDFSTDEAVARGRPPGLTT